MNEVIFSGSASVEFQGDEIFTLLNLFESHAEFRLIGFQQPQITVLDYRKRTLQTVKHFLETGQAQNFPQQFNIPATVKLSKLEDGNLEIALNETTHQDPKYMLWAAIGIGPSIPVYDYLFYKFTPLQDELFAFISLYERPYIRQRDYQLVSLPSFVR